MKEEQLPPAVAEAIERGLREGVTLQYEGVLPDESGPVGIHWNPGDPNPLAETIIRCCHRPLTLVLDGHRYVIGPA